VSDRLFCPEVMMSMKAKLVTFGIALACADVSLAGGGPLGIDHKLEYDNSGIWKRSNQHAVEALLIGGAIATALWQGSDSRLGKASWQSIDSMLVGGAGYLILNNTTGRLRPSQTNDPSQWGEGGHSFPSGETTVTAAAVTPYILQYHHHAPAVYALAAIPLYIGVARMKTQAHWQTDILASWALGAAAGYYAHSRDQPFTVNVLPHGVTVGWHKNF
jgi:hypothetical protein